MKSLLSVFAVLCCASFMTQVFALKTCDPNACTSKCCKVDGNTCATSATSSSCYYKVGNVYSCISNSDCLKNYNCDIDYKCHAADGSDGAAYSCNPDKCTSKCC